MKKLFIFLIVFVSYNLNAQVHIYETDSTGAHYLAVKAAFLTVAGYLSPTVNFRDQSVSEGYMGSTSPIVLTNHSYTSLQEPFLTIQYRTNNVLPIAAHGSNASEEINYSDNEGLIRVAAIDAGGENNNTSYGLGLDFVEKTPECGTPCQSYASPRVMGKFYVIKHKIDSINGGDVSWSEVFYRAKRTASNNYVWNERTGWGIIDINKAVSYAGTISPITPLNEYNEAVPFTDSVGIGTRIGVDGNSTFLYNLIRLFDTSFKTNGAISTTTDASGDITVTIPAMPDATYTAHVEVTGTGTNYLTQVHTKTTTSFKVRFKNPTTEVAVGAGVSIAFDYDAKDY